MNSGRAASTSAASCSSRSRTSRSTRTTRLEERLGITPLQMAMVAAAIANDGVLMQPYLVQLIRAPGGR